MSYTPWFKRDPDDMGGEVSKLLTAYKTEQQGRRMNYIRNLELFEGRRLGSYSAAAYNDAVDDAAIYKDDRLGLIRSAVATAVSTIYAAQKPKPQFQTLGATWAIRRKAYRLDRICEGILNQRQRRFINVWALMVDAAVDAALQGDACIKVVADKQLCRIVHEVVPAPDLFFDPVQGRYPTELFQVGPCGIAEAHQLWPKADQAIDTAQPYKWLGRGELYREHKTIEVQYGWRLPYGDEDPGAFCTVVNGKVVDHGEWTAPAFPFVFLQWEPHRDSPWASGIADEARQLAAECSEIDLRLVLREILASGKKIYYRKGSVKTEDLELNDAVVGVPVDGDAPFPTETVATPFSPMELDFLRLKKEEVWDRIGISQMSAAARREPNITSGIAMMTLNDTKAGRQLAKSQRYEQLYVDLAHQYVWRLRELADEDKNFMVRWPGKQLMREQKWSEADVEDDMFAITVAPSSSLPHDPAGRQQMVMALFQSALISQETAKSLIGWPDLDSELNMENAEFEYIDSLIEKYLDAEPSKWGAYDYQAPEGFIVNKPRAIARFGSAWFRARIDQMALPKEEQLKVEFNLSLLTRYIKELDALMTPPAPEEPAAPPPDQLPGGAPAGLPGNPMAPPVAAPPPPTGAFVG